MTTLFNPLQMEKFQKAKKIVKELSNNVDKCDKAALFYINGEHIPTNPICSNRDCVICERDSLMEIHSVSKKQIRVEYSDTVRYSDSTERCFECGCELTKHIDTIGYELNAILENIEAYGDIKEAIKVEAHCIMVVFDSIDNCYDNPKNVLDDIFKLIDLIVGNFE